MKTNNLDVSWSSLNVMFAHFKSHSHKASAIKTPKPSKNIFFINVPFISNNI